MTTSLVWAGASGLLAAGVTAGFVMVASRWFSASRWRRRGAVGATLAAALFLGSATAAFAASNSWDGYTYQSIPNGCAHLDTTISNAARPRMDSAARFDVSNSPISPGQCSIQNGVANSGTVAVRQDLYWWNGSSWVACNYGPWVYNSAPSGTVSTGFGWGSPPCGVGYYTDNAASFVAPAGTWNGGWRQPNYLYVS